MSKETAVRFIEDYGREHFLNDMVKDIKVKTRLNDFYIYATVWDDYNKLWRKDPVARLQWPGDDTYQLAYFRHTGKWHNIFEFTGDTQTLAPGPVYEFYLRMFAYSHI